MGREQDLYSNPQGKPVSESRSNPTPASSTGSCLRIRDTNFPSPRASGAQLSHTPARKVFPTPAKKKKKALCPCQAAETSASRAPAAFPKAAGESFSPQVPSLPRDHRPSRPGQGPAVKLASVSLPAPSPSSRDQLSPVAHPHCNPSRPPFHSPEKFLESRGSARLVFLISGLQPPQRAGLAG